MKQSIANFEIANSIITEESQSTVVNVLTEFAEYFRKEKKDFTKAKQYLQKAIQMNSGNENCALVCCVLHVFLRKLAEIL